MIEEIIKWIDKELKQVQQLESFLKYFAGKEIVKDDLDRYISNESEGIDIVMSKDLIINTIHLSSKLNKNRLQFDGELPFEVKFSFSRNEIRKLLGAPNKTGGGHELLYVGYVPFWDKYHFESYTVHFQYSVNNLSINVITIASLQLEEYFNSKLQ